MYLPRLAGWLAGCQRRKWDAFGTPDARSPSPDNLSYDRATFGGRYVCFKVSQAGGADGGKWGWRLPLASHGQMRCQRWCSGTGREWASTLPRGNPKALGSLGSGSQEMGKTWFGS